MSFNGWKNLTLGEVCIKITDGAHFSPKDDIAGLPMASVKDLYRYGVNISSCRRIGKQDFEDLKNQGCMPIKGDILIAKDGNTSLDTVCVFNQNDELVLLSSVAILRPNVNLISSDFLNYYFDNPVTRNFLKDNFRSGSAIPRVVLRDFRKVIIKVPDLNIQKKITNVLRSLDNKIELNLQSNQTLEEIAQALFKKMCLPKTDELPEGWRVKKILEIGKVITGKTPSSKTPEHFGEIMPFVTPTDFKNYTKIILSAYRFLSNDGIYGLKSKVLPENSIIVTCIGSDMGKVGINKVECVTNQQINSIIANENLIDFLYYSLLNKYELLRNMATGGSTMPMINKSQFEEIELIVPDKSVLENFQNILSPINEQIKNNIQEIQTLTALRDSLLPKLMKGEIELKM
ncbi:MAG: restriction endonuclease subunit S [Bacteroidales bacterium]|nr:restriction endonuclease subunit S [Bacteroidales bacterium]